MYIKPSLITGIKCTWSWWMIIFMYSWIQFARILVSIFASIFIREIGLKLPFFNGSLYGLSIIVILASYNKLNNVLYLLISHNILKSIGTRSSFLTRVRDRPGKKQQARIFCGKALLLTQEQERKREWDAERWRERGREQRKRAEEKTKRKRRRGEERECQNPVPFKENYPPPRTCHSLIGCSPSAQLSSRERQSTWRGKLPLHMCRLFTT